MKVRSHIALLVAAILIPVGVFSVIAINLLLDAEREAAYRSMHELARATLLIMDKEMEKANATARALSISRSLAKGDFADFYEQAKTASDGAHMHTALIDEHGQQVFNTVRPYGSVIAAPAQAARTRVAGVLSQGRPVYSNLIKGSATRRYVVSLEQPLRLADGRQFVLSQWIFSTTLNELLPSRNIPESWLISVFDREGITIARNRHAAAYVGQPPKPKLREAILARHEGLSRSVVREGVDMYGAWAISRTTGWSVGIGVPVKEIEQAAVRSVALAMLGFVFAIIVAVGGAIAFSRRLVNAITGASRSADLIGMGQIPDPQHSPVDEMNRLQQSLHRAAQLLVASNAERDKHLHDAELAFAEAERARGAAEQQNRAKDEFLAMLGHELRNPLAAITSGVTLLNLPGTDAILAQRATTIIERQTRHLVHLVDELLDAHRILSGKLTLTKSPLDLCVAVESCLASYDARGATRTHRFTTSLAPATVLADPTRLEQMLSNLIENAIKYTPDGGSVSICVEQEGDYANLSVTDSGIGIAADVLPSIFDVFVQGKVINRSKGGLGIGLAVVSALAKQHDAVLAATSPGINQGTTFSLRFPLCASAVAAIAAGPAQAAENDGTILVIEDNADVREVICNLLGAVGFRISAAGLGRAGIDLALSTRPEIAIVDIDLPDMTGYDVARELRSMPATAAMRLIAVTGYGQESDRRAAFDSGFDAHLKKPVNLDDVLSAIRRDRER